MTGDAFAAGDLCLLLDGKERRFLLDLDPGRTFQYHAGVLPHADIIGRAPGSVFRTAAGGRLIALRPRLADYILRMKRGAQVVYPKDIGPILHWADIRPGSRVLEAGTGSGALTMALLEAVGPSGTVVSVELRDDHAAKAGATIERYFGELPETLEMRRGDVADHVTDVAPDRIVLDLPEPWSVVPAAAEGLRDGGIIASYLPTVPQIQQLQSALRSARCFVAIESFEVMLREWVAEGRSVRPSHRMVGHTGFITIAHKTEPLAPDDPA